MFVLVKGNLTLQSNATISMTARGSSASDPSGNVFIWGTQSIPATGGSGANGVQIAATADQNLYSVGTGVNRANGTAGSNGTNRGTGGGGSGFRFGGTSGGAGTAGQGNNGGAGDRPGLPAGFGGGGGGAGGVGANATANNFSNIDIYISNYRVAIQKVVSIDYVGENNATEAHSGLVGGTWTNTAAITSIKLFSAGGNLVQYSTATLYGILNT
jgi:hypothetical protein